MSAAITLAAARGAGRSWVGMSWKERRRALKKLATTIASHQDDLVSAIVHDTGKPPIDALGGDVLVTLEHMRFYYKCAHKVLRKRRLKRSWLLFWSCRFLHTYEPHGVVLIFGPSNYPLQLSMVPAITALYAGNAVVIKLSERTPKLAAVLQRIVTEACFPHNLLQIVTDAPTTAIDYVDARPDFICFTGSSSNGKKIRQRATELFIPTLLELGGKDAAIVFADCNFERTVEGILYGAFVNSGQVCLGVKRLYLERSIFDRFITHLSNRIQSLRVGNADGRDHDISPVMRSPSSAHLEEQIKDALRRGAIFLNDTNDQTGATPVLLGAVAPGSAVLQEESFGPLVCVGAFDDEEEAVELANDSSFALGASIWTQDVTKGERMARKLMAANIAINDVIRNIANPAAEFGGNRSSGHGRYHGEAGLITFSRSKTVMTNHSHHSERNWFPFRPKAYSKLRSVIRMRHSLFALLVLAATVPGNLLTHLHAQENSGHLHLRVKITKWDEGQLAYLIFSTQDGFPNHQEKAIRRGFLPKGTDPTNIDLGVLPAGRYAVSLFLDRNDNKKLDSGWLGIPKEPVGASNNPKSRMGPPHFEDCSFQMGSTDLKLEIDMVEP